jgi:hypothetical protein
MKLIYASATLTLISCIPGHSADETASEAENELSAACTTNCTKSFHVSPNGADSNNGSAAKPWKTIQHGVASLRQAHGPNVASVVLNIHGGTYRIDTPIRISNKDSAPEHAQTIIKNFNKERVTISGARSIEGWSVHDSSKGIYKATVGDLAFRQVYADGTRYIRARTPNVTKRADKSPQFNSPLSFDKTKKTLSIPSNLVAKWNQFERVEMIYSRDWVTNVLRLKNYTEANGTASIELQEPERSQFFGRDTPKLRATDPFYFENAYGFLDDAREWYLDRDAKTLYLITDNKAPPQGVEVPVLDTLVEVAGTEADLVRGITFQGIEFSYSTWTKPDIQGLTGGQSIFSNLANHPGGAIVVNNARRILIEGCAIRNVGNQGILVTGITDELTIKGNIVETGAANGIVLYGSGGTNVTIADNFIRNMGLDFGAGTGVVAQYSSNTKIANNDIWGIPYAGVSLGWGWTKERTHLEHNAVRRNAIHNVCQQMSDCGAIYTLSRQDGTILEENWIHDVTRSTYANGHSCNGIFHDEGSSEMTDRGNVFDNIEASDTRRNETGTIHVENTSLSPAQVRENAGPRREETTILRGMNYYK